jgi:hypothetical protein
MGLADKFSHRADLGCLAFLRRSLNLCIYYIIRFWKSQQLFFVCVYFFTWKPTKEVDCLSFILCNNYNIFFIIRQVQILGLDAEDFCAILLLTKCRECGIMEDSAIVRAQSPRRHNLMARNLIAYNLFGH